MKKIVITNTYGYKNIGDGAILDVALRLVNKAFTSPNIQIHSATIFSLDNKSENISKVFLNPYGIAIRTSKGPISDPMKIFRFSKVVLMSLCYCLVGSVFMDVLPNKGDYSFIRSIKEADIVLGVGGGYLRTKNKYKDFFGLILTVLPIFIAHLFKKRILYLPMSYGNFASLFHDKIVFHNIKSDKIIFRDEKSQSVFKKNTKENLDIHLIPDLALFDTNNIRKERSDYIVVTARQWLNVKKQKEYEKKISDFVDYVWNKHKLKTVFIPMVWNEKEEDDKKVGIRIYKMLKNKIIFKIHPVKSPNDVKKILAGAKYAVCTRMHSAILSTVVRTPFITIAYEYKTRGFLKYMGLEEWNIDIEDLSLSFLKEKFENLVTKREEFIKSLGKNHENILKREIEIVKHIRSFRSTYNE